MNRWIEYHGRVWMVFSMMALVSLAGCGQNPNTQATQQGRSGATTSGGGGPVVVVSIPPLASLVEPLVGSWGKVETLLPVGAEPHDFQPAAHQMKIAAEASLLVVIGRNLDGWAEDATIRAAGNHPAPTIFTCAQVIDGTAGLNRRREPRADKKGSGVIFGITEAHGEKKTPDPFLSAFLSDDPFLSDLNINPHLWLDPVYCRRFIAELALRIESLAPNEQARAQTRQAAKAVDLELEQLDQTYHDTLAKVRQKNMVTYHNAFDLLAARYGLHVAAHLTDVELAPGGEVSSDDLIRVINVVRKLKLAVIYAEPEFPARAVAVIAQETGVQVLKLDPLGGQGLPGYGSYLDMMNPNLKVLVQGQDTP